MRLTQAFHLAHHLVDRGEPKLGHDLACLLGHHHHVVHHVFRLAAEARPQLAVLRGDAHGAGILLAIALHQAAHRDERHGGEPEFFGAQEAGDRHIATIHQLAIGFEHDAAAQTVLQQGLLRFGQAHLERQACMMDRIARGCTCATVRTGDEDLVRTALGNAGRDRAYARFGNELDRYARAGVGVLQIEDELGQVLDRIDVVMRRRRNEPDTWC